ncbi:MAG: RNA pseudouridine synthase [Rhizobiales bacterium]|nr:RNA pseudouridine synthase [Hyphomicrobiales bacterium]
MTAPAFHYEPPTDPWLTLIHEDRDFLVFDKPSGLLCVAGKPAEHADCLEARVQARFPEARIVHRLDRATSGLLLMARTPESHRHLGLQFERRHVHKTYIARVWGDVQGEDGLIDLPLATDPENRPRQCVDHAKGRPSQTEWRVMAREADATRLRLTPRTGRSHQLRVHMLSLGHPILGDHFYAHPLARNAASRLQLHAAELSFFHPTGGARQYFTSPCPF